MKIQSAIAKLIDQQDLSHQQMQNVMQDIMTGKTTDAQIAGFLIALRLKGETTEEITACATVMRELSHHIIVNDSAAIDIVGTGGDGANTFNISTACAFTASAAGASVAKHGNRSVSSRSGSADCLELLGIDLNLKPEQVADCINQYGCGFMFAPMHHSAMKYAIGPRKELGVRTIFNLLGPLTNPANVKRHLIGVFAQQWCEPLAQVLQELGSERALIVHSDDGLDEISIAATTQITELNHGQISHYQIAPEDFGIKRQALDDIIVNSPQESQQCLMRVLNNEAGAARDIVVLNTAAALMIAGITDSIHDGIERAKQALQSGAAFDKLQQVITFTKTCLHE